MHKIHCIQNTEEDAFVINFEERVNDTFNHIIGNDTQLPFPISELSFMEWDFLKMALTD